MKKNLKLMKILALSCLATTFAVVGTLTVNHEIKASAQSQFKMIDGALVRMDTTADESAIRFIANVPDLTDKGYRMLIVPTKILEVNEIAADDDVIKMLKTIYGENYATYFLDLEVKPFSHEKYGSVVMGAMKKINAARYAEQYTGIAYYEENGEYQYAAFGNGEDFYSNARSVSYVASVALNSGEFETDDTVTQKDILESFVESGLVDGVFDVEQSNEFVKLNDSIDLSYSNVSTTELDVQYVSSNEDVATVDADGRITILAKGEATITASIGNSFSDTVKVNAFTAGTKEEMQLALNYTPVTKNILRFYDTNLATDAKDFGETVTAPQDTSYGSYVEYILTTNANRGDDCYYANFLNFSAYTETMNSRSSAAIAPELYEKYKDIDWSNAYMSFWAYNANDVTATLYGTLDTTNLDLSATNTEQQGTQITTLAARTWTKVTVSLKNYCNIESDVIATGNYNIKLWMSYTDTSVTAENVADKSWKTYLTGLKFFSPSVEDMMAGNYSPNTFAISKYERGALSTQAKDFGTVSVPEGTSYDSYIDYTMSGGDQGAKGNCTFATNFINFSAYTGTANTQVTNPISADLYARYKDIDWTNAYISFYLYNGTGLELTLYGTDNDFGGGAPSNSTETYGAVIQKISASAGWTKVSISLADYCGITSDVIATGNYNIKIWLSLTDSSASGKTAAEVEAMTWSFYMTGFEFFSPDVEDMIAGNYTSATKTLYRFYDTTLSATVKDFGEVVAPTGTTYESYLAYTLTTNANKGDDCYYANFIDFSTSNAIPSALYEKYKNIDWTNANISFWLYNDTDLTATLYGTDSTETGKEGAKITTLAAKTWTKVTISLAEYCGVSSDGIATGTYNIKLWILFNDTSVEADNLTTKAWSFYMTGFEFASGI